MNSRDTEMQFFQRFRFPKNIVIKEIIPMIYMENNEFIHGDNRGLPIQKAFKILIALRFYASGNYQVCK